MNSSKIVVSGQGYLPRTTNILNINQGVAMRYKYDCCRDMDVLYQDSSQAARYDFSIQKGSTLDLDLEYKDCERVPMNLTGYSARFKAAESTGHAFTASVVISRCREGMMKIHMSPYETSKIWTSSDNFENVVQYRYQLELVSPANDVYRILEGVVNVAPSAGCRS